MSFNENDNNNTKNMMMALVAFIVIMFAYNYFFETNPVKPAEPKESSQSIDSSQNNENIQQYEDSENINIEKNINISKEDALLKNSRISIENNKMIGSIDLNGGIIDSIMLKDYKETIEEYSKNVSLLNPKDTESEFYYLINYKDKTNNETISDKTVWVKDDSYNSKQSIKLKTQTQNGIIIERTINFDDMYLIDIKDKIINVSDRDLIISNSSHLINSKPKNNNYAVVHEGIVANSLKKVEEIKYSKIKDKTTLDECEWAGYTDIYWLCSIINKDQKSIINYSKVSENVYKISSNSKYDLKLQKDSYIERSYSLFTGPKDINILKSYMENSNIDKFDMSIDFGWFFIITKPLVKLMSILEKIFTNMGLVILFLTLMFKFLTYPLMKKSFASAAKMKEIQPKIAHLQKMYKSDKMRMNQEMMALYKKEKVSPMSGCLPMLLQAPIFFCLYKVFFISIEMRHAPLFGWIHDLSASDNMYIFNLFGAIDWDLPGFLKIGIWPLIMGISMFLQQKLSTKSNKNTANTKKTSEQKAQENMMLILPILFTYICASFPVGVVIYWTISNIFSIIQQYYTNKKTATQTKN